MIVTDPLLDPYYMITEGQMIVLYKKRTRIAKEFMKAKPDEIPDAAKTEVAQKIGMYSTIEGAKKAIVEDVLSNKNKTATVLEYIKLFRSEFEKIRNILKLEKHENI